MVPAPGNDPACGAPCRDDLGELRLTVESNHGRHLFRRPECHMAPRRSAELGPDAGLPEDERLRSIKQVVLLSACSCVLHGSRVGVHHAVGNGIHESQRHGAARPEPRTVP